MYILKNIYYTTGATSGAGTAFLSEVHEFTMVFSGVRVTRSLVLCVMFVDHCLSFCIFILAIVLSVLLWLTDSDYPLVSSNSSYSELYVQCTVFLIQILEIMVFSSSFFRDPDILLLFYMYEEEVCRSVESRYHLQRVCISIVRVTVHVHCEKKV